MEKKLPKVFANKIDKSLDNNENVYYSKYQDDSLRTSPTDDKINQPFAVKGENINQKINSIFSSPKYVYKADVDITTKEGSISKRIIGRNSTHLITIDNELISVSDIVDIKFSQ